MAYRNRILAGLDDADLDVLRPHLHEMEVAKDYVLIRQDTPVTHVHFPETAEAGNVLSFSDGRSAETAIVGCEGVTGLAPFMAEASIAWNVIVHIPGVVIACPVAVLLKLARDRPPVMELLLRLTHDYQSQAAQSAACNALHTAPARLARWLLQMADRTDRETVPMTQQDMAFMLGMQRTTVTSAAQELKRLGAVSYSRGHVTFRDRTKLKARACECYAMQRKRTEALAIVRR